MEGFKGTRGPWVASKTDRSIGPVSKDDDQSYGMILPVAWVEFNGKLEHQEADANLIAAAPELLEALQLFAGEEIMAQLNGSEFVEPTDDEEWVRFRFVAKDFRKAAAAIKKALGQ